MNKIKEVFENQFHERFGIELPEEALTTKQIRAFRQEGWVIQICFGNEGGREYMDYYASHRMTSDRHCRIYEDGELKDMEALSTIRLVSKDPVEDKKLEKEFFERNRRIAKELAEKGFGRTTINQYLATHKMEKP